MNDLGQTDMTVVPPKRNGALNDNVIYLLQLFIGIFVANAFTVLLCHFPYSWAMYTDIHTMLNVK